VLLRLALSLIAGLCPLLAAAQTDELASSSELRILSIEKLLSAESAPAIAGSASQVVPLWASADGRLLAIVGMTQRSGAPILPPSPAFGGLSDLRIIDATDLFSTGLRWRPGHGLRADMVVGVPAATTTPLFAALGCVSLDCATSAREPESLLGSIGAGWTSDGAHAFDLSFGLSWLDVRQPERALDPFFHPQASQFALLALPDSSPYRLDSSLLLSARGSWQLERGAMIDLSAGVGRSNAAPLWYGVSGAGMNLDQVSLGLGIANGSLRGSIVGHVISTDDPAVTGIRRWSGLDLGVSWRTPWRGEVSFGAQNLWSAPLDVPREADSAQSRMPYVQYRQDL
jgi:hypothetical protein